MQKRRSLNCLHNSFDRRIIRLASLLASTSSSASDWDRCLSYVAIEALNAWASFSREFYLSCAWVSARSISGATAEPTTMSFISERAALLHAISIVRPKTFYRAQQSATIDSRDEPTWHEPSTLTKLSAGIALSNNLAVLQAFSYPTTFFRDMPVVRNFYAHRNKASADKVKALANLKYGIRGVRTATELIGELWPGRSQSLANEWLDDLRLVSFEACY